MRTSNRRSLRGKCAQGASRSWEGGGGMCYQLPHILPVTRDIKVGGLRGSSSPADRLILAPQVLSWCCQSIIFFCSSSVICFPRKSIRLFLFVCHYYWIVNCLSHQSNLFRFTKSALVCYLTAGRPLRNFEDFYFSFISAEILIQNGLTDEIIEISRFDLLTNYYRKINIAFKRPKSSLQIKLKTESWPQC